MDISRANSRLSVIVFIIIAFSLNTSSQHLYSEEESEEIANKCTVYGSDFKRSSMETDQEEFNSKACGAVVKCHPNEMSIFLSKSLLLGVNRQNLRLLDSNCTAKDNGTHFFLTTTLIGCSTSSTHTNDSVVYSNMVRQVFSPTTIITRAPEVKISFSCHYSKHGIVSTGALTRRKGAKMGLRDAAGQDFASVENICRNERLFFYSGNPTSPATRKSHTTVKKEERTEDRESAP
ncbi:unnamed protein product [Porites lobata]|uniref:ZP domain-containing protein n=1 Tax=Porites lobata TaxID=104759 RepID=A0ABN8RT41_9CNID|nr:unnamed protein product [Porites lobata]